MSDLRWAVTNKVILSTCKRFEHKYTKPGETSTKCLHVTNYFYS